MDYRWSPRHPSINVYDRNSIIGYRQLIVTENKALQVNIMTGLSCSQWIGDAYIDLRWKRECELMFVVHPAMSWEFMYHAGLHPPPPQLMRTCQGIVVDEGWTMPCAWTLTVPAGLRLSQRRHWAVSREALKSGAGGAPLAPAVWNFRQFYDATPLIA